MKKSVCVTIILIMVLSMIGCGTPGDGAVSTTTSTQVTTTAPTTTTPTTQPTTTPTTSPTTTPIVLPTAPDKDPSEFEYKPADIPQEYWAVLNNQQEIYFDYPITVQEGYDINSKETAYLDVIMLGSKELAASKCYYCVIDLDGNGKSELLIRDFHVLVLSEKNGVVYGWNGLGPVDIFTDGTYSWSEQAGANNGRSRLVYIGLGIWSSVEVWRVDRYMLDEPKYYFAKHWVSKKNFDSYMSRYQEEYTPEYIEWKELSRYPLYSRDEKYPPLNGG